MELPHDKLKSKLSSIVDFVLKGWGKTFSRLSNNGAAYWGKKTKGGLAFSKSSSRTKIKDITESSGIKLSN